MNGLRKCAGGLARVQSLCSQALLCGWLIFDANVIILKQPSAFGKYHSFPQRAEQEACRPYSAMTRRH